ncbi:MAG: ATP-binding protein [Lawsonibacter sp.]|jgi:DNA polymerase-3 subunit delta'
MDLTSLAGNERLKEQLVQRQHFRGLAHAYLISGPKGSGRHTLARWLCAAMLCTSVDLSHPCGQCSACKKVRAGIHPDVQVFAGERPGKALGVDQIRQLRTDAFIRPNEGERKVYVLEGADEMNPSSQNAMLKLLEEGPSYAAFLLLAENEEAVLQTVRSRCETLILAPVPLETCHRYLQSRFPDCSEDGIRQAAQNCQGILGRAVEQLAGNPATQKQRVEKLCLALETGSELDVFEEALVLEKQEKEQIPQLLDALEEALVERMAQSKAQKRLNRAIDLIRQLRAAARLNVGAGPLAGWLCAGLFVQET